MIPYFPNGGILSWYCHKIRLEFPTIMKTALPKTFNSAFIFAFSLNNILMWITSSWKGISFLKFRVDWCLTYFLGIYWITSKERWFLALKMSFGAWGIGLQKRKTKKRYWNILRTTNACLIVWSVKFRVWTEFTTNFILLFNFFKGLT